MRLKSEDIRHRTLDTPKLYFETLNKSENKLQGWACYYFFNGISLISISQPPSNSHQRSTERVALQNSVFNCCISHCVYRENSRLNAVQRYLNRRKINIQAGFSVVLKLSICLAILVCALIIIVLLDVPSTWITWITWIHPSSPKLLGWPLTGEKSRCL